MGCQVLAVSLEKSHNHFVVVGRDTNSKEILKTVEENNPHIALVSANLRDGPQTGFAIVREIHRSFPKTRAIVLLEASEPELVVNAFRAGAKGIFCRAGSFEALCKCIRTVHKGQIWATSEELQSVMDVLTRAAPLQMTNFSGAGLLTKREEQVVHLVAEGLTNNEIASKLNLSAHTIKNYVFRIFDKLGISNRVELVIYALDQHGPRRLDKQ
jgi:DNA-binding NarL/FixJ family response regulator